MAFPAIGWGKEGGRGTVSRPSLLPGLRGLLSRREEPPRKPCPRCGTGNPRKVFYCKECGFRYPDSVPAAAVTPPSRPEVPRDEEKKGYLERGNAFFRAGQYERAVEMYDRALSIDGAYAKAWHNRALALQKLGRMEEAAESRARFLALRGKGGEREGSRVLSRSWTARAATPTGRVSPAPCTR
ncbi:MAG: tetratricopeptide repeat protein [Methanolinea sp.]